MSNKAILKNKYVTIWDGQWGKQIVIEKSYKDKKTQEWKRSNKFFENELPELISALQEAMQLVGTEDTEQGSEISFNDSSDPTNVFNEDDIPF